MRRRGFSALLSGAIAWPLVTSAQPSLRVAALWPFAEGSADGNAVLGALRQGLRERGRPNVQIDNRWGGGNIERSRAYAAEIVKSSPDVIFAYFNTQLSALFRETRTIPIVFVGASDPVAAGYVASLTRPGGNVTGFTLYEPTLAGKWLELLKQVAPGLERVALLVNPDTAIVRGTFYLQVFDAAAASLGVKPIIANVYSPADIEAAIASLGKQPGSALVVAPDTFTEANGDLITTLAAQHRVPAIYAISRLAARGGLMSYGPDALDAVRRATAYVDRLLRGEKAAELPIQAPVKFDLLLNVKSAKALGIEFPPSILARADEVIE